MVNRNIPNIFRHLLADMCIDKPNIVKTPDGFFLVNKSIANILSSKDIFDVPDSSGERLSCSKFFDDWFLYAVPSEEDYTYSLLLPVDTAKRYSAQSPIRTRYLKCISEWLIKHIRHVCFRKRSILPQRVAVFFCKVGSFEEGYKFDAVVLDDIVLVHPQSLNLA